ncbi:helix-turn-helix domain-containing protein [Vibrio salinus]|uniref:helix-turn-helix domain-containing protein n=1 Tax=Vibrio salinus TaxID=2899784 RepID=UPI001E33EFBC|nr:helix-turn-helix transcriptional regulator [Vibrio salinus]MCE0494706.1 helix-turn-helix domain-containing protein [Vibrio salinus]
MEHVGRRLKEILKMKGISASQMAQDLNVGKGHISNIINGRIQTPKKHISAIAEYLKISSVWLLTGEGSPDAGFDGLTSLLPIYTMKHFKKKSIGTFKISGMTFTENHYGLVDIPTFPDGQVVILSPKVQGDGYFLVEERQEFALAQRIDKFSHIEWNYLSGNQPDNPSVLGKVEAIIMKELINYEMA